MTSLLSCCSDFNVNVTTNVLSSIGSRLINRQHSGVKRLRVLGVYLFRECICVESVFVLRVYLCGECFVKIQDLLQFLRSISKGQLQLFLVRMFCEWGS